MKASPYSEIRTVRVRIEDGKVFLSGKVRSFYLKQFTKWLMKFLSNSTGISVD